MAGPGVGGAGSSQSPADPPCPLGWAQTSKWSLPNLSQGQEAGGRALSKEQAQSREAVISTETFSVGEGGRGEEHHDRMKCERLAGNTTGLPIFSLPGSPGPSAAGPRSPSRVQEPGGFCLCFSSPASSSWHQPPSRRARLSRFGV